MANTELKNRMYLSKRWLYRKIKNKTDKSLFNIKKEKTDIPSIKMQIFTDDIKKL